MICPGPAEAVHGAGHVRLSLIGRPPLCTMPFGRQQSTDQSGRGETAGEERIIREELQGWPEPAWSSLAPISPGLAQSGSCHLSVAVSSSCPRRSSLCHSSSRSQTAWRVPLRARPPLLCTRDLGPRPRPRPRFQTVRDADFSRMQGGSGGRRRSPSSSSPMSSSSTMTAMCTATSGTATTMNTSSTTRTPTARQTQHRPGRCRMRQWYVISPRGLCDVD